MSQIGDNSEKAAKQRRVQFSHYHQKDRDLDAQIRALGEQKKENRLNAKAAGFPSSKLDHYLKTFRGEDKQKPVDKWRSDKENLIWQGLISDDRQGDLLADRVTNEQLIQAKGFDAGLNNLDRMSHYDGGSAEDRLWLESYDAGKREYADTWPEVEAKMRAAMQAKTNEEPAAAPGNPFAGKKPTIN